MIFQLIFPVKTAALPLKKVNPFEELRSCQAPLFENIILI